MRNSSLISLALLLWLFNGYLVQAEAVPDSINFKRIPQRSVQNFLRVNHILTSSDLMDLSPACIHPESQTRSHTGVQYHLIKSPIDTVWKYYSQVTAQQAWDDQVVSLGLLYSRQKEQLYYGGEANEPIEVGAMIMANIKLLLGLLKLGVAFEVTGIDPETRTIQLCYLEHNKSKGTQEIHLEERPNGYTRVVHTSRYLSDSSFRDIYLYPIFHRITVGEFHRNLSRLIKSKVHQPKTKSRG